MNRRVHLAIGIVLFLAYVCGAGLLYRASFFLLIAGACAAAAGSLLPDILEPPTCAKHRGFFHGRRVLAIAGATLLLTALPVLSSSGLPRLSLLCSSCFSLGYAGHLLADSLTRAGLPG
jgi:hypothetical protein